ncbi:MAG: trypsin-like peptidase domain-containing protein [Myxococcota bacterium]
MRIGIGASEDQLTDWGTGVLLGPRVVATCHHVVARAFDRNVSVRLGEVSCRGKTYSWPLGDEDDEDVAFIVLDTSPLTPAPPSRGYPTLISGITTTFIRTLGEIADEIEDALVCCGYRNDRLGIIRAHMDYGAQNQQGLVTHVRLDEGHVPGESGGPVLLLPPRGNLQNATRWSPCLTLGLLAQGARKAPAGQPKSYGSVKSFFVTSNALLRLRDELIMGDTLDEEHGPLLAELKHIPATSVVAWLPLLRGEPPEPDPNCDYKARGYYTQTVRLLAGAGPIVLNVYVGKVIHHRVWHVRATTSRGIPLVTTNVELLLLLRDKREKYLTYSVQEVGVSGSIPLTNSLRAGHRVTIVWATDQKFRRGVVAACYVRQMQRTLAHPPRYVMKSLVGPIDLFKWSCLGILVATIVTFFMPHRRLVTLLYLLGLFVYVQYEQRILKRAIHEFIAKVDPHAPTVT